MKVGFLWLLAILTSSHEARGDDAATAEDFYNAGQEAYDHGDYMTAIAKWQTSYQLSNADGLLFNIAQAKRLAGDCRGALAEYRRFLAADPGAPQHALATDLANELAERCGDPAPPPPPPQKVKIVKADPPPNPVVHDTPTTKIERQPAIEHPPLRTAGLVIGGVGLATFATGLYFGHRAQALGDEVTSACHTSCDWATWKSKDADGRTDAKLATVLDVVGVAGLVAGAGIYYLGMREDVAIVPTSNGGAIATWSGLW